MERKEVPTGIIVFIVFILALACFSFSSLGYYLLFVNGYLQTFLSLSLRSIILWIDALLTVLSLLIIPYGFLKRKKQACTYAFVYLADGDHVAEDPVSSSGKTHRVLS